MQKNLRGLTHRELEALAASLGSPAFRARQISHWVFQKLAPSIEAMTSLPRDFRRRLAEIACISRLEPMRVDCSRDGSKKYLFTTSDGHGIESVLIPEKKHWTLCVSTQIGCAMGCRFCFTGSRGLIRDLSAAEIVNQVCAVLERDPLPDRLPNLVFMGMGEPLANYANTLTSLRVLTSPYGFGWSHRRITVSTAGLIPQIRRLAADLPVNLAISLNAPDNAIRDELMPINRRYPLEDLLRAAREFPLPPRKRITFEYILIQGVNDAPAHARELARRLQSIPCKINLIPFNGHCAAGYQPPDEAALQAFQNVLLAKHFTAPIRRSKGSDIAAACGQLGATVRPDARAGQSPA